jgi:hypothetical protein
MVVVLLVAVPVALAWRALLAGGLGDPLEAPATADVLFAAVSAVAGAMVTLPLRRENPQARVRRFVQMLLASLVAAPVALALGMALGAPRPGAWGVVLVWPMAAAAAVTGQLTDVRQL